MDKLVFLFPRKQGLTREEFFAHYLDVHAPLGLEVTQTMVHYTVNLCDRDGGADDGVDAITETWTDSVADFMDPAKSFATPEDAQRLMTDHDSFIGAPYDAYSVAETVRKGTLRQAPQEGATPGTKVVVAVSDDATLARLAPLADRDDVSRFVENRVTSPLMTGAFTAVRAFVEVHGRPGDDLIAEIEALVTAEDAVHPVSEYVKK
jgi:hypothetical protein